MSLTKSYRGFILFLAEWASYVECRLIYHRVIVEMMLKIQHKLFCLKKKTYQFDSPLSGPFFMNILNCQPFICTIRQDSGYITYCFYVLLDSILDKRILKKTFKKNISLCLGQVWGTVALVVMLCKDPSNSHRTKITLFERASYCIIYMFYLALS